MESHLPTHKFVDSSKPLDSEYEKANEKELTEKIQKLPKLNTCWLKGQTFYKYEGFWYPLNYIKDIITTRKCFKAQPTDIILSSFPKTGTTWLKALVFSITTRKKNKVDSTNNPLLNALPHDCVLFLEFDLPKIQERRASSAYPPVFASHLPYSMLPDSVLASDCKILYIYRDPKDTFVSYWHFMHQWWLTPEEQKTLMPLDEAFEEFCSGSAHFGPFWDHVLSYYRASMETPERILMLKYEDLKGDALSNVKRLAEFIGSPFSPKEEKEGVVESILKFCSFENLSSLEVNKTGRYREGTSLAMENSVFFRKGKVGDWENHLTDDMKERIDLITKHKLGDLGLL